MRTPIQVLLLLALSAPVASEQGLTLGMGAVTVKDTAGPFPVVDAGQMSFMLLPDITYRWSEYSIGTAGAGWHKSWSSNLKTDALLGYPRSKFAFRGSHDWLRYGASVSLNYADSLSSTVEGNVSGIRYSLEQGHRQRTGQWQRQLSVSAPLWIPEREGAILLGKLNWIRQNSAYTADQYDLSGTKLSAEQRQTGIGLFVVWPLTDKLTSLLSVDYAFPDEELTALKRANGDQAVSIFTMFSYALGRL